MRQTDDGGLIETGEGATFVRSFGQGPLVFVIHGGPGFDHCYLLPELSFLARKRTLIFYDQPGCGRTPPPAAGVSAEQTFRHFNSLSLQLADGEAAGVIAHSWGALVLAASFSLSAEKGTDAVRLREGLLINPVPITRKAYDVAASRLIDRVPPVLVQRFFATLETGVGGPEVMRSLMPYYCTRPFARMVTAFPFEPATYAATAASLGDFDYTSNLGFAAPLSVLLGEHDFTGADLLVELIRSCHDIDVIPSTGHFPFFEAPDEFRAVCERCFAH